MLGLASICGINIHSEAINIVIEKLEDQPFLEEIIEENNHNSEIK